MNYLGHMYVSGDNAQIMLGNFIGDAVKGSNWKKYARGIQQGIHLHRFIDGYMEENKHALEARKLIRPYFSLTSPIVLDMFFDHFLSANWSNYHPNALPTFSENMHKKLKPHANKMPGNYAQLLEYMVHGKWFESYRTVEGIGFALNRMGQRVSFENNWEKASVILEKHYLELQNLFEIFISALLLQIKQRNLINPAW